MGLFDSFQFDPTSYMGDGGLLGRLKQASLYPTTPQGSTQDLPDGYAKVGDYLMPQFGRPDQSALPENATMTSGQAPQAQGQAVQQPLNTGTQQASREMSLGGRLMAGAQTFFGNPGGGVITNLLNGINTFQSGQPAGENLTVRALTQRGIDADTARVVARDPAMLRTVLTQQMGYGGDYSKQPIYGTDAKGNPIIMQLGQSGGLRVAQTPQGVSISTGVEKIDAGTHWVLNDKRSGQVVGTVPKDLKGAESEKAVGKSEGEAKNDLASIRSKMPGLELVVKKLDDLSNRATYTAAGQIIDSAMRQSGMEPRGSAVARAEYISMVDNQILPLLRDTFGAQFTQKEGETLRSTLGDPNKSPAEKQAVLRSFIAQKRRDIDALEYRISGKAPSTPSQSTNDPLGIR